jgi:hypothetical protein
MIGNSFGFLASDQSVHMRTAREGGFDLSGLRLPSGCWPLLRSRGSSCIAMAGIIAERMGEHHDFRGCVRNDGSAIID